jgi:hypothetical protein
VADVKKLVRVRALHALVVFDDDVTAHVVPKGMQGTLVGAAPNSTHADKKKAFSFVVDWDFHAIGDSTITREAECDPACCEPGFSVDEVPLDAIEVIGVQEIEDDEPAAVDDCTCDHDQIMDGNRSSIDECPVHRARTTGEGA